MPLILGGVDPNSLVPGPRVRAPRGPRTGSWAGHPRATFRRPPFSFMAGPSPAMNDIRRSRSVLLSGHRARRAPGAGQQRGGIAAQDAVARLLTDIGLVESLAGPIDAERG